MMRELGMAVRTIMEGGRGKGISRNQVCEEEGEVDVITVRDIRRAIWDGRSICTFYHFIALHSSRMDSISGCLVIWEVDTN